MKSSQKIQFVLTPIFICILSIMLVVVSFSWYKVSASTNIQTESSEVSIKAEAPKGMDVAITLTPIGDDYEVIKDAENNVSYSLTMVPSATNPDVGTLNGYYGQTGLKEYPDLDKVYIAFYKAVVSSSTNTIDINSAYISKSVVERTGKEGFDPINEELSATNEATSPYQVRFYNGAVEDVSTGTGGTDTSSAEVSSSETENATTNKKYTFSNEIDKFSFTNPTLNDESEKYELTIYVGVKFTSTSIVDEESAFKYSNIKYFGSTFTLTANFVNTPTN